jgi:peptidoglycan/LPS O-acetylase OafA/YrhL
MLNRIGHGDRPLARIMTPYVPILFAIFLLDYLLIGNKVGGEGLSRGVVPLIGNLFMLQDYPAFQMLDLLHINVWWRIRTYNTAEPFWTVAVEFWTYIAVGLFFFCVVVGEKINKAWKVILILLSAPVFIWNAAAGGGHALSLIWAAGAIAGYLIHGIKVINPKAIRIRSAWIVVFGAVALGGRIGKSGIDPYDLQSVVLLSCVIFGIVAQLNTFKYCSKNLKMVVGFFASYSYSLYLIHDTVFWIVSEYMNGILNPFVSIGIAFSTAHIVAYVFYLCFERWHRFVGACLGPIFERAMMPRPHPR